MFLNSYTSSFVHYLPPNLFPFHLLAYYCNFQINPIHLQMQKIKNKPITNKSFINSELGIFLNDFASSNLQLWIILSIVHIKARNTKQINRNSLYGNISRFKVRIMLQIINIKI